MADIVRKGRQDRAEFFKTELLEYAARQPPESETRSGEEGLIPGGKNADEERRKQLRYIQDFFHNPMVLELKTAEITTSSSKEEVVQRIAEVQYRVDLLEALLTVFRDELQFLSKLHGVSEGSPGEETAGS